MELQTIRYSIGQNTGITIYKKLKCSYGVIADNVIILDNLRDVKANELNKKHYINQAQGIIEYQKSTISKEFDTNLSKSKEEILSSITQEKVNKDLFTYSQTEDLHNF